ncbi:hypothetical protein RMR21_023115 (plasmid) [Agrobacterium sp. rho-8.1]
MAEAKTSLIAVERRAGELDMIASVLPIERRRNIWPFSTMLLSGIAGLARSASMSTSTAL